MKKSEIKVLLEIKKYEELTLKELSGFIKRSPSFCSKVVKELEKKGIVTSVKEGRLKKFRLVKNPYTALLLKIIEKRPAVLEGRKEKLLSALTEEKSLKDIQTETGISLKQIIEYLQELASTGIVERKNGRYRISEKEGEILEFFSVRKFEEKQAYFETVWKKGDELLARAKERLDEKRFCPTAFSLYPKYGLQIYPDFFYYYHPPKKLEIEEIFVHSLKFVKTKQEALLATLFYLKYRYFFDQAWLKILLRKFDAKKLFEEMLLFLRSKKAAEHFPSFKELKEKAKIYGIEVREKSAEKEKIFDLFCNLDNLLSKRMRVYLIGGGALVLKNVKTSTKDIDIILENKRDFELLKKALANLGFKKIAENVFESGIYSIDAYVKRVLNGFALTKTMKKRAEVIFDGKFLKVYTLSNEDLFLLKTYSGREGDIEDCEALAKLSLNWKNVLEECLLQEKKLKKLFSICLLDMLEELKQKGIHAPPFLLRKLTKHCTRKLVEFEIGKGPKTVKELVFSLQIPEPTIRKVLKELEREGRVKKRSKGRVFVYFLGKES